jgi:hypothetical protein
MVSYSTIQDYSAARAFTVAAQANGFLLPGLPFQSPLRLIVLVFYTLLSTCQPHDLDFSFSLTTARPAKPD